MTNRGARWIAIVGAESTGKSVLAHALASALAPRRVAVVDEWLREWCAHTGRTPLIHEQGAMLRTQHERISEACASHDWVIADTTALQTAAYSAIVFGDASLRERALTLHAPADATLLTALDLPWQPDEHQRDGPQMQAPVDGLLRRWLTQARLPFAVVHGTGDRRLAQALAALAPLLHPTSREHESGPPGRAGLFSGLGTHRRAAGRWWCECCDPQAEAALRRGIPP